MATIRPQLYSKNKKRRHLVIVSQTRFIIATLLTLIILSIIISYFAGLYISEAFTPSETVSITVSAGDTLWSIASQHNAYNEDIREVVYRIRKQNELKSADIFIGQELEIPVLH